jgi:hypothetical protein
MTHVAPLDVCTPAECVARPSAERVSCPTCDKVFAGGAVVTRTPPNWDAEAKCWSVPRMFYCDHCKHVVSWLEASDDAGVPTGEVLVTPIRHSDKRFVAQLLASYPELKGVVD